MNNIRENKGFLLSSVFILMILLISSCRNAGSYADDVARTVVSGGKNSSDDVARSLGTSVANNSDILTPPSEYLDDLALKLGDTIFAKLESKEGDNIVVSIWNGGKIVRKAISCSDKLNEYTDLETAQIAQICKYYALNNRR